MRVIVELYDPQFKLKERFEPTKLRWVSGEKYIDIASEEDAYVNLMSQIINRPNKIITNIVRIEVEDPTPRGIGIDRVAEEYILQVIVHGDNIKNAPVRYFKFTPDEDINKPGSLIACLRP